MKSITCLAVLKKNWLSVLLVGLFLLFPCGAGLAVDIEFEPSLVRTLSVQVNGGNIAVDVAAGMLDESSELYLVWDSTDHGGDLSMWPQDKRVQYEGVVSSSAATYIFSTEGIPTRSVWRVIATSKVKLMDGFVKIVGYQYVDTGVKCNEAYGIEIRCRPDGTYDGPSSAAPQWGSLVGSDPFKFSIGRCAYGNPAISYDQYLLYRGKDVGNPLFMLSTAEGGSAVPHTLKVENQAAYLDGIVVKSELGAGSLGMDAATIFIGSSNKGDGTSYGRYAPAEWYYARINDASGNALVNLIPARLGSEALFYDTVSGKCFGNSGTSTAPFAGQEGASVTNTLDLTYVSANSGSSCTVAHWTGHENDGSVVNPGNWALTNSFGMAENSLPDASTSVFFSGMLSVQIPVEFSFTCKSVTLLGNVRLADDCDWSGLPSTVPVAGVIDLNGHQLVISTMDGYEGVVDSSSGGTGVIAVNVDAEAGQPVAGSSVFDPAKVPDGIDRKIVKTGAGTLVLYDLTSIDLIDAKGGQTTLAYDPKPTLVHRWSFNGDYKDSVGGSDGQAVGEHVALSEGGKTVVLSSDGSGQSGYVNLGTGLLPSDSATIEIWGKVNKTENWSHVFHYGPSKTDYVTMTWSAGTQASNERFEVYKGGRTICTRDGTMAPYTLGTQYHISVTFKTNADGSTAVRWMRRNAATGALEKSGSALIAGWSLADLPSPQLFLGHSQYYPGNYDANAEYDEVRIWHGVVSDTDLNASAALGPDVMPSNAAADVVYQPQASYDDETFAALKANNYLLHRWNFNRNARDSVGESDALFHGNVAYSGNTSVSLSGGNFGASWIDLGANAIPATAGDAPFTIEMWTTLHSRTTWGEAFSFGSARPSGNIMVGATGIIFTYNNSSSRPSFLPCGLNDTSYQVATSQIALGKEYHLAIVVVPDGAGGANVTCYMYDAATGELFGKATQTLANWTTSRIVQNYFWLGHSLWNSNKDQNADFNEVRVWNAALSEAQVRMNNAYGPDRIPAITAESVLSAQDSLRGIAVASGAVIDLGGNTLEQFEVSGAGTIQNGSLVVTGRFKATEGETMTIASGGTLDITGADIVVTDSEASMHGGLVLATSPSGGIVPAEPRNLDGKLSGYTLFLTPTRARVGKAGLIITVR